jgi:hypothetical protein
MRSLIVPVRARATQLMGTSPEGMSRMGGMKTLNINNWATIDSYHPYALAWRGGGSLPDRPTGLAVVETAGVGGGLVVRPFVPRAVEGSDVVAAVVIVVPVVERLVVR